MGKNKTRNKRSLFKKGLAMALCSAMIASGTWYDTGALYKNIAKAASDVSANANKSALSTGKKIKNIIYMIPDGGGYPSYDLTKAVKEAGGLTYLENNSNFVGTKITAKKMYLADYLVGSAKTKSNNNNVTDSAAGGTALATGKKTNNGYVGVDPNKKPLANLAELAEMEGKSTGIVVTCYQYDATPGAFSAHASSRDDYDTIITQMGHTDLNLVLGAGINKDGTYTDMLTKQGYTFVSTETELEAAAKTATAGSKIWSTMHKSAHHLPYDHKYGDNYDGIDDKSKTTPTLAEMTGHAIDILEEDTDGFFLMIEGSKIDYGCHNTKTNDYVADYIAFDEAFHVAVEYAKGRQDTAVIAVPDHNTGINSIPTGDKLKSTISALQKGENPTDGFSYTSGNSHSEANVGVWMYLPEGVSGLNGLSSTAITNTSDRDKYVVDNTEVSKFAASLISDLTLEEATSQLYVDVTKQGSYKDGVFTFSDTKASVTVNTDKAKVDGKEVDLDGELVIWSNSKCYMSKKAMEKLANGGNGGSGGNNGEITDDTFVGKGTKAEPYEIKDEASFLAFTSKIKAGEKYEGIYFKQTAHIDMANVAGYTGLGKNATFAGVYNGQGYTINVAIKNDASDGIALFPYTSGTIINLGTTGTIENTNADGAVSGVARSIRDGACVVNCWSTIDLTSKKEAGAISLSVRGAGVLSNCYYKGKIVTKNNYGMGMTSDSAKAENSYYALETGSTEVTSSSSNKPMGTAGTEFAAATLNGYLDKAVSSIDKFKSTDEFCKFVDLDGQEFAFEGSKAVLASMSYTYTALDGTSKTVAVENFTSTKLGYEVKAPDDIDSSKDILLSGTAVKNNGTAEVKEGTLKVDSKGFATGEVRITTSVKNAYYETTDSQAYNVNLSAPAPGTNTPIPNVTATPTVTTTPVATKEPEKTTTPTKTETPTNTAEPAKTETPAVTATPKVSEVPAKTEEPKVTATPVVTNTNKPTESTTPVVSGAPTVTKVPQGTAATTGPAVTITPTAIATTSPVVNPTPLVHPTISPVPVVKQKKLKDCVITGVNKSYTYKGSKIKPTIKVQDGEYKLVENIDYVVFYVNNKNVGTAKILMKGIGNYKGEKTISFKIAAKSIKNFTVKKIGKQKYTGKSIKPAITIKDGDYQLKKGKEYRVVYKNNKKKGTATVLIYGKGNYKGTKKITFVIK